MQLPKNRVPMDVMTSIHNQIRIDFMDLQVGESKRAHCPFCKAKDTDFSVTRTNTGIKYNCFRASCKKSGFVPSNPSNVVPFDVTKKKDKGNPFQGELSKLPEEASTYIADKYHINEELQKENGFMHDVANDRLAMPILAWEGTVIGYACRQFPWSCGNFPKVYNYWEPNVTGRLHYAHCEVGSETVVIVEDILSAIRVSKYAQGVALLGTNLTDAMAEELSHNYSHLIIALDRDATKRAIEIKQKVSLLFSDDVQVKHLSKDPKDMTDEEIEQEIFSASKG